MSFRVGSILFFDEYQFTDNQLIKKHFGLVLLPEHATQYQNSVLCCVITSKETPRWSLLLKESLYSCFDTDSYACFNRKDMVSKDGLNKDNQPRGTLNKVDMEKGFKILKQCLYAVKDIGSNQFFRGTIIYQWKKALGKI